MGSYEYKVVTAPTRGTRARGVKSAEGRFAHALEDAMNELAAEGWEYVRAETLPSEERSGLTATQTVYRNVLVFRRPKAGDISAYDPRVLDAPAAPTLLLPPIESFADEEEEAPASDHGLSSLLKRRAARLFTSQAPAPAEPDAEWDEADESDTDPAFAAQFDGYEANEQDDTLPSGFYGTDTLEFARVDHTADVHHIHTVRRRPAAE